MGLGGTVAMDLWALLLHFLLGTPKPAWHNQGRWVVRALGGTVFHDDITATPRIPNESATTESPQAAIPILKARMRAPRWSASSSTRPRGRLAEV